MMPGSILTAPLHRPVGPSFAIGGTRRRGALEFVVSTMSLRPGSTLGPYAIRAELGHGGMGIVYTAHDPRLKRQVAIKLLTADLTRDETAKQRFLQEVQAASALDHPNICTIHEINETDDGQLYLVMAYYEGETLKKKIARGLHLGLDPPRRQPLTRI